MKLLESYESRITNFKPKQEQKTFTFSIPKASGFYSGQVNYVDSAEKSQNFLDFASQRPLSHIGFDSEFGYSRRGVLIRKNQVAEDPRSIKPHLFSFALAQPMNNGTIQLYPFVVDVRNTDVLPYLGEVFRLSVPFVGHFLKVEFFCLWQLDLKEPPPDLGHLGLRKGNVSWTGPSIKRSTQECR